MGNTETADTIAFADEQRYRRWMNGLLLAAGAGFILLTIAWFIFTIDSLLYAGVAILWIGLLGALVIWKATSIALYDERDTQIEQEASHFAMGVFAYVILFGLPAVVVFSATGVYEVTPRIRGMLDGYVVLFIVFGLALVYFRSKRS